jgi:hypothetical protein
LFVSCGVVVLSVLGTTKAGTEVVQALLDARIRGTVPLLSELVIVLVIVFVNVRLESARLTEDLRTQRVRHERLNVRGVLRGLDHQIQQIRGFRDVGDEVRAAVAETEVQDLDVADALTGSDLTSAGSRLCSVNGRGNEDGNGAIKNLIEPTQHVIVVVRNQHTLGDAVATTEHRAHVELLCQNFLQNW